MKDKLYPVVSWEGEYLGHNSHIYLLFRATFSVSLEDDDKYLARLFKLSEEERFAFTKDEMEEYTKGTIELENPEEGVELLKDFDFLLCSHYEEVYHYNRRMYWKFTLAKFDRPKGEMVKEFCKGETLFSARSKFLSTRWSLGDRIPVVISNTKEFSLIFPEDWLWEGPFERRISELTSRGLAPHCVPSDLYFSRPELIDGKQKEES